MLRLNLNCYLNSSLLKYKKGLNDMLCQKMSEGILTVDKAKRDILLLSRVFLFEIKEM